jgi:predicted transcriptional regulator
VQALRGAVLERGRNLAKSRHKSQLPGRAQHNAHDLRQLTAWVVASFVSNHSLPVSEVPELINVTYRAFAGLRRADADRAVARKPAVPIEQSVTDDFIVCLEDGRRLKTLKRYIRQQYALTPQQYRVRWGLPPDYPMVAPSYARLRSSLARREPQKIRGNPAPAHDQSDDSDERS